MNGPEQLPSEAIRIVALIAASAEVTTTSHVVTQKRLEQFENYIKTGNLK